MEIGGIKLIRIEKQISLELTKPNIIQAIVAKQYDMNSRFLTVTLTNEGDKIDVPYRESTKVVINAQRVDGQSKGFEGKVNENGTVTVPLTSWMLELEGTVICDISVIDTTSEQEKKLTTTSFTLLVEKAAYGGSDITLDPQYDVLVKAIERVTEVEKSYVTNNTLFANAIKQTAIGNAITINDVSPIEHELKVKVKSKNIMPYPYVAILPQELIGVTFSDNGDGGIKIKGMVISNLAISGQIYLELAKVTLPAGTYNGASKKEGTAIYDGCMVSINQSPSAFIQLTEPTEVSLGIIIMRKDASVEIDMVIYPMIYKYERVYESYQSQIVEGVTVSRYGKNILDVATAPMYSGQVWINNNGTQEWNYNYERTVTGFKAQFSPNYNPSSCWITHGYNLGTVEELKGKTITVSGIFNSSIKEAKPIVYIRARDLESGNWSNSTNNPSQIIAFGATGATTCTFTVGDTDYYGEAIQYKYVSLNLYLTGGGGFEAAENNWTEWSNIQVEINNTATEYEPYKEPQTAIADKYGVVNGLTSISPSITLFTEKDVTLECEYNTDTKTYIDNKFNELSKALLNV